MHDLAMTRDEADQAGIINLLQEVNRLRNISSVPNWAERVKKIVVILSSPRSGSSMFKSILREHPDIASLDGEIEPFLKLTHNGFGFNSDSDAIGRVDNRQKLLDNIFDNLSVRSEQLCDLEEMRARWSKRLLLQFPDIFSHKHAYDRLSNTLVEVLSDIRSTGDNRDEKIYSRILDAVFLDEPWRIDYYDGFRSRVISRMFGESVRIEEPPFVVPSLRTRSFTPEDSENKVLLFKSSADVYRIGMYEQLFPRAQIMYIHLMRGYAQAVNSLMDAWLSPVGFFSHDMKTVVGELKITGYSNCTEFGRRWWKLDLPPNWRKFTRGELIHTCLNQWLSAQNAIWSSGVPTEKISLETLLDAPNVVIGEILRHIGVPMTNVSEVLPMVMAVKRPARFRWHSRANELLALTKNEEVAKTMHLLGYNMDPEKWV